MTDGWGTAVTNRGRECDIAWATPALPRAGLCKPFGLLESGKHAHVVSTRCQMPPTSNGTPTRHASLRRVGDFDGVWVRVLALDVIH